MNKTSNDISFLYNEEPDLDKAWDDLRRKLDEKLPVKKKGRWMRFFIFPYKTATILPVLMTCSLLTRDYNHKYPATIGAADIPGNTTLHSSACPVNKTGNGRLSPRLLSSQPNTPYGNNPNTEDTDKIWRYSTITDTNRLAMTEAAEPLKWRPFDRKTSPLIDTTAMDAFTSIKKKKGNRLPGFDMGVYYNAGSSLREIYPMVNMNIKLTEKSALSVGIGISSNVHTSNFTPRDLIILNDTANRVKFGITSNVIRMLTYIDLPVSFKYAVSERWIVHTGMQLSFLQHFDAAPAYKAYNFQDDISKVISPGFVTGTNGSGLTPLRTYTESYTVKKVNWRLIAGISYHIKGIGFKGQFQQSITSNYNLFDFRAIHSAKKLSIFTLGVYYSFR